MLSKEAIAEMQEIHEQETGMILSKEDACALAMQLLTLYDLIYKPIPKTE